MSASINRHMFTETGTDTGALTVLGTVVHQFPDEGDYVVEVHHGDRLVGSRLLVVDDEYHTVQVSYDLAAFGADEGCDCHGHCSCEADFDCIREDGFAVFHVGSGAGGYRVTVDPVGERRERREFDSAALGDDDTVGVLLLRPGRYSVRNDRDGSRAEVTVRYPDGLADTATRAPVEFTVSDEGIEPRSVEVDPGRGLRFDVETEARLVVELEAAHEKATDDVGRPAVRRPRLGIASTTPFDPAELTRDEVESAVADVSNPAVVRALLLAERRGKDRSTVVETLRKRVNEVQRRR